MSQLIKWPKHVYLMYVTSDSKVHTVLIYAIIQYRRSFFT